MGLFDSIRTTLCCPVCGSIKEREIQTKQGPCAMLDFEVGDTIEPFFYGDYWIEEDWHCNDCEERAPEEERWKRAHKAFVHCNNGLIVDVTPEKPLQGKVPDWDLIHKLSRDRRHFRATLRGIRNSILDFRERSQAGEQKRAPFLNIGPKTIDELLSQIVDDIERAERGELSGFF